MFEWMQSWKRTLDDAYLASPHRVAHEVMMKCRLPSPCPEYERFTSGMLVCPNDSAWVADDKAKTIAWMAKKCRFQQAAVDLVEQDPGHWSKELTSPEDQGNINRDLHRRMAKRLRCRVSGPGKWGSSSMPYMYMSVKSKCCDGSSEALGLLCKKPGHSQAKSARGTNTQPRASTEAQAEQCR